VELGRRSNQSLGTKGPFVRLSLSFSFRFFFLQTLNKQSSYFSLASFLLPLLAVPRAATSRPRPETACSSPEPAISMLGQPPSVLESHVPNTSAIADGDDLDVDIRKMYDSVRMQDPKDIVWKENLDERDGRLFMDGKYDRYLTSAEL